MRMITRPFAAVLVFLFIECVMSVMYSSRLIHRFSNELKAFRSWEKGGDWPEKGSIQYYRMLVSSDVRRQKMKLGSKSPILFPSEGGQTDELGNDFGWLHYTWIDIGMPSVSFLVALDTGSDLLWLPCDCLQCAPLSAGYYKALDRDLNEYRPSGSSTSKHLSCSHQLCELGSNCKTPKQPCPYVANYSTDGLSSSGLLVEDIIHLVSHKTDSSNSYIRTPVIIGCGKKQSGEYLDGVAPDGVMGLGLQEISVPSFLGKAGVIRNSFSLCFSENDSGRVYFGDRGPSTQQTTPFLPLDGEYKTYITGVEACCIGGSCLEKTSMKALFDSGTSFTSFPNDVYNIVVKEFDGKLNASRTSFEGYNWQYCYKASSLKLLNVPSVILKFGNNSSFLVHTPIFEVQRDQVLAGFCLPIQPSDLDIAIIGQNYIRGYRMVFDRENLKLGWSRSTNCQEMDVDKSRPLSPPPNASVPNPFPTEQQHTPDGHAVAPAVAGRTPAKSSATTVRLISHCLYLAKLLFLLLASHQLICIS